MTSYIVGWLVYDMKGKVKDTYNKNVLKPQYMGISLK